MAEKQKPHDAVEKFDRYRNLQRHRAVMPATARLLLNVVVVAVNEQQKQQINKTECDYVS